MAHEDPRAPLLSEPYPVGPPPTSTIYVFVTKPFPRRTTRAGIFGAAMSSPVVRAVAEASAPSGELGAAQCRHASQGHVQHRDPSNTAGPGRGPSRVISPSSLTTTVAAAPLASGKDRRYFQNPHQDKKSLLSAVRVDVRNLGVYDKTHRLPPNMSWHLPRCQCCRSTLCRRAAISNARGSGVG